MLYVVISCTSTILSILRITRDKNGFTNIQLFNDIYDSSMRVQSFTYMYIFLFILLRDHQEKKCNRLLLN
jgi:hypothetical protein